MVKFFTTMEILHLAVICSVLFTVNGNDVAVTAKGTVSVRPNEEADLSCTTDSTIKYCTFYAPNGESFQLEKGISYNDGRMEYFGEDETKDCGIKILNVMEKDNGEWRCEITAIIGSSAMKGSNTIQVTVLKAPSSVTLNIEQDLLTVVYPKEAEKTIKCTAEGGQPAPTFSWNLSGVPAKVKIINEDQESFPDGTFMSYQEVSYSPQPEDSGKLLECVANSQAYTDEDREERVNVAEVKLDIQFAPTASEEVYDFYGLMVGDKFEIRISFRLNPKPTDMTWIMHDGIDVAQGSESESGKYRSALPQQGPVDEKNMWIAMLTITNVEPEDDGTVNKLILKNEHGEKEIKFKLTVGEKPPVDSGTITDDSGDNAKTDGEAGTGPIIAIIIIILLIIIVVGVFVVAKARGQLCFAAGSKKAKAEDTEKAVVDKEEGDTESADQAESAKPETAVAEPQPPKLSVSARMTSLLSAMKKTVGGKRGSSSTDNEELNDGEEKQDGAEGENKDDIVYADLDKSAMSGNDTVTVEQEKTEYAEIK